MSRIWNLDSDDFHRKHGFEFTIDLHLCKKPLPLNAITNILKLTRPMNLVIVIATMLVVRYAVMREVMSKSGIGMKFTLSGIEFLALTIAVVAITAAGNIINDYFDQKVDKINKPERVVVGKKVKRRVAIVLHQALNAIAFLMALIVCYSTGYYWPIIIPVIVISLLWWYSPVLKKKVLIGNLTVAACTASVPLWAAIFEIHGLQDAYADMLMQPMEFFRMMWLWILALCFFAFILTLIREAIKDVEDMAGDREGDYKTLPIVHGERRTKNYVFLLMSVYLIAATLGVFRLPETRDLILFAVFVVAPAIYSSWSIHIARTTADFHKCSQRIKIMMAGGLIFLVWVLQL